MSLADDLQLAARHAVPKAGPTEELKARARAKTATAMKLLDKGMDRHAIAKAMGITYAWTCELLARAGRSARK